VQRHLSEKAQSLLDCHFSLSACYQEAISCTVLTNPRITSNQQPFGDYRVQYYNSVSNTTIFQGRSSTSCNAFGRRRHRPSQGASHGLQNGGLFTFTNYEVSLRYVRWLVYESAMDSRYSSLHVNLLRKTQTSLNTI